MAAPVGHGAGAGAAVGTGAGASVRRPPAGGVAALGGMGAAAAAAAASKVAAFVSKVQDQMRAAFWARRATIELPQLETNSAQVIALAQATSLTPEQVVERFEASARALDTCAQTLARIRQFEVENDGKLPRQMRDTKERLVDFANNLADQMSVFEGTEAADDAMTALADTGDASKIAQFQATHADYTGKARRALGIANYDMTVREATAAMEALQAAAAKKGSVSEGDLLDAWEKTDAAMEQLRAAQEVVDRVPVALTAAARKKGKSGLARLVGKTGKRLTKLVRSTAEGDAVKAALEASRAKQAAEAERVTRERAAAEARGEDPDEVVEDAAETVADLADAVNENIEAIEAGPTAEFTREELTAEEREIAVSLEAALLAEWDGVTPSVKENLVDLVTRGLHLKRAWAEKNPAEMSIEKLATDPAYFDMAQLIIELLELYHDANRALEEVAQQTEVYERRLPEVTNGVMKTFNLAWNHLVIASLAGADGVSYMDDLFALIDQDRGDGEGAGDLTDKVEAAYKRAWELYFNLPGVTKQKSEVMMLLSGKPMFPDA